MKQADAEEYTQSLGQIFSGSWRQIEWAERQGIPKALGLSLREWVRARLGGYTRFSIEDRRDAVGQLGDEGYSNVAIGEILGVDETTVRRDKRSANAESGGQTGSEDAPSGHGGSANAESVGLDAGEIEESQRYTLLQMSEFAYRGLTAFAAEGFVEDLRKRLKDPEFVDLFRARLRIDPTKGDIEDGFSAFSEIMNEVSNV